ncbi:hypothetical protein Tco_0895621 [Tanacetum coccineum]|uniref:Uncharacterized protein n=1 Tax=Tanacetum coccineum TaxID=301880 RepID=A0ABQ5CGA6_9ASTR
MDESDLTMEAYIELHAEKAQRRGRTFNWETATYDMALPPRDQRYPFIRFEGWSTPMRILLISRRGWGRFMIKGYTRMAKVFIDLDVVEEIGSVGFGLYWAESARQISDKGDLNGYWRGISFEVDFIGATPSYTLIRDPLLRLRYASRRKRRAMISGVRVLLVVDMDELVRLQICDRFDDTWAWVAPGPERQSDVATRALGDVEGTHYEVEGVHAILAPVQAPQPPPVAAQSRTLPLGMARL